MTITNKAQVRQWTGPCGPSAHRALLALVSGILLASGGRASVAQTAAAPPMLPDPVALPPQNPNPMEAGPLLLGAGDLLQVQVFNTPELTTAVRVDQQGRITLALGTQIDVAGLTARQAGEAIEKQLRDGQIMLDPHVTVFVTTYATQGVVLLGEVRVPGTYTLFGPHSLYDALSLGGGTTTTSGPTISITHQRDPSHPVLIQVHSANYSEIQRLTPIEPGDNIFVSKAEIVYVVGDVARSGPFAMPYGEHLNVLTLISLMGGLNSTAAVSKSSIVRPTATGAETIPLNLNHVMKNVAPNLVLQANDVLVVPRSGTKVFLQQFIPSLTSAGVSAGVSAAVIR